MNALNIPNFGPWEDAEHGIQKASQDTGPPGLTAMEVEIIAKMTRMNRCLHLPPGFAEVPRPRLLGQRSPEP